MKILGQIVSIQPLAIIVSLPNQLYAHVPITHVSSQLTNLLELIEDDDQQANSNLDEEAINSKSRIPDLFEIFSPGQYVRAVVTAVHALGPSDITSVGRARDDASKSSRRVELSLVPARVNAGVCKTDLRAGFVSQYILISTPINIVAPTDDVCCCKKRRGSRIYPRPWSL
jgi:rRNA biogenesis protein RRP5